MTIQSVPLDILIDINSQVVNTSFNAVTLAGLNLSQNALLPVGAVQKFNSIDEVGDYFGIDSAEETAAGAYFASYQNSLQVPPYVYFARYIPGAIAPTITSDTLDGGDLTAAQAIDDGQLTFTFNGDPFALSGLDFSAVTSFEEVAGIIQTLLNEDLPEATVVFNATDNVLIASNNDVTGYGSVGYATSSAQAVAVTLKLTNATDAVLVQGSGAVAPYIRGGAVASSVLAQLNAITNGALTLAFDDSTTPLTGLNFATDTSFSEIADTIQTAYALVVTTGTVEFSSTTNAFTISNGLTGTVHTVTYASSPSGSLASLLNLTEATGAVLSQGSDSLTPAQNMDAIIAVTTDWMSFTPLFDITASPYTTYLALCAWVTAQNPKYGLVLWSLEANLATGESSISNALAATTYVNYYPNYCDQNFANAIMGTGASINYNALNGRISFANKTYAGITPFVNTQTVFNNLQNAPIPFNSYIQWGNSAQLYNFSYNGAMPGTFLWIDNIYNQRWLANQLENAIAVLFGAVPEIPNNTQGYSLIKAAETTVLQSALNNGVAQKGNTFNPEEIAILQAQAGVNIADRLTQSGYYIQILPPTANQRALRTPPTNRIWYTNAGSIFSLVINLTYVF